MANHLKPELRAAVVRCLADGCSLRATSRITGVSRETISRIVLDVGAQCAALHDRLVRGVAARNIEVDEVWSFVGKKQAQVTAADDAAVLGDCYTFIGIDADTRLILAYRVAKRTQADANAFMVDLAGRCAVRPQLSSDGWQSYPGAVEEAFGREVDFAVVNKQYHGYGVPDDRRYSPSSRVKWQVKRGMVGHPAKERICTSHVERANLSVRMRNRRFTRLTNAFSKSWAHHAAAFALTVAVHNLVRGHGTLGGCTPAMVAGLVDGPLEIEDLLVWCEDGAEASAA